MRGEKEKGYLGLDVDFLSVGVEPGNVNLNVEVTDVAENGILLHDGNVLTADDV
jgi:hypothetical protein